MYLTLGSTNAYATSTTRFAMAMMNAPRTVTPMTVGKSFVAIDWTASCPIPGSPKTVSVMNGSAEQQADVQPQHRDDRGERAAQTVLVDHPALGQALRAGCPDVVLVHRLDQVAADHPRVEGALM